MTRIINIKKFRKWIKRVRAKYFSSPEDFKEGLESVEKILEQVDRFVDSDQLTKAREWTKKIKDAVDTTP